MDDLIGKTIRFAAEPYHYGTMRIDRITPSAGWKDRFVVEGTTVEAIEVSRLMGASRRDPHNNRPMRLYPFSEAHLRAVVDSDGAQLLRHIYPV